MDEAVPEQRSKRKRIDKNGKMSAFERLKQLKGKKNKCVVEEEMDNVFDYVEDDRQDGFYSDEEEEDRNKATKSSSKRAAVDTKQNKSDFFKKFKRDVIKPSAKFEDNSKSIADDPILAELLEEMRESNKASCSSSKEATSDPKVEIAPLRISPRKTKKEVTEDEVKNYMENFKKSIKKPKLQHSPADDELDKFFQDDAFSDSPFMKFNKSGPSKVIPSNSTVSTITETRKVVVQEVIVIKTPAAKPAEEVKPKIVKPIPPPASPKAAKTPVTPKVASKIQTQTSPKTPVVQVEDTKVEEPEFEKFDGDQYMDEADEAIFKEIINQNKNTKKVWFMDAWEDNTKRPGEIFLFGKTPVTNKGRIEFHSICVIVENVDRCLYVLPKSEISLNEAMTEFSNYVHTDLNISSCRSKVVEKLFCFNTDEVKAPKKTNYLMARYPGKAPLPHPNKKFKHIQHIFGTSASSIENFLLETSIKGPSWIEINNYNECTSEISWCKQQISCSNVNSIKLINDKKSPPPSLVVCCLNIKSMVNPDNMKTELVMISMMINNNYDLNKPIKSGGAGLYNRYICGVTRPTMTLWPKQLPPELLGTARGGEIVKCENERALLSWFLANIKNIDPDLLLTYDADDCQLNVLQNKLFELKIPHWSRIGRLRMQVPTTKRYDDTIVGRLICDIKTSAEELVKLRSFDLETLVVNILKVNIDDFKKVYAENIPTMYKTTASLSELIKLAKTDCEYTMRLMYEMNVLPLALQITAIAGNLMSRTLRGGRSERNEFLLLHAFNEKNYILPDKLAMCGKRDQQPEQAGKRKKAAYSGGLVLDPIVGFYDKFTLLMDFNSLYPSIIQEYNVCFTTIDPPAKGAVNVKDGESSITASLILPDASTELGILPRQIRRLVESRRDVKKLMAKPDLPADLRQQYNIRQLALKLTANSMYGCLGFSRSRFFAQHLAALITEKGRDILLNTKSVLEKLSYSIIYGDTDSIVINTNSCDYNEVYNIGLNIKQHINKIYRNIELDIDGVYKFLLLLKKKKYAALTVSKTKTGEFVYKAELKGLDIVRRDWSRIACVSGQFVVDELLSGKPLEESIDLIHSYMEKLREDFDNKLVPLSMLEITKQVTKALSDYADGNSLPHVLVASRMNKERQRHFKRGDMISYIICLDGTDEPAMKRAYHIDEITQSSGSTDPEKPELTVDLKYYLEQQIHPVISRLIGPIEGTDSVRIAELLGLDGSKFKKAILRASNDEKAAETAIKSNAEKFRTSHKFLFECVACKKANIIASGFKMEGKNLVSTLLKCANEECQVSPIQYWKAVKNQLVISISQDIEKFYQNTYICDEQMCQTRASIHVLQRNQQPCLECDNGLMERQYREEDLNNQLLYYIYMFDVQKYPQSVLKVSPEVKKIYEMLKDTVERYLKKSKYFNVSMSKIYQCYQPGV